MRMTEQEARDTMRASGWTYLPRKRGGREYVYAERKVEGRKVEKYICSYESLPDRTIEWLQSRLAE